MTRSAAAHLILACAVAGCAAPGVHLQHAREQRGSAVRFARPPVVNGRRDACLAPPYAPPAGTTRLAGGVTVVARDEGGRRWIVKLPGARPADGTQVSRALGRLRARPGLTFLSYGLYCGDGRPLCLHLAGNLCQLRVEDAVRRVRAAVAADPALADMNLLLAVELAGNLRPRCARDDPHCLPIPYEQSSHYDAFRPRHGGAFPSHSAGSCSYDGECVVAGCGNHCLSWQYGGANEGATCEGYVFPRPVFCGCVDHQCGWFSQ